MATMSTYSQFSYPYTAASQLLMTASPGNNVPPSSSSSSSASSASSAGPGPVSGATSPAGPLELPAAGNHMMASGAASNQSIEPSQSSSSQHIGAPSSSGTASPCCDSGRLIVADPVTGHTVCSCQYDRLSASLQSGLGYGPAAAAAAAAAARLAAVSSAVTGVTGLHGVYSAAYPSSDQNPYPSLGMDGTFYSSLTNPYSLKDPAGGGSDVTWSAAPGLHQSAPGYYPYDPALAAYGYGAGYDLAARRKNATRESTATLKAWLSEHKKNPYPTKGEKIMLAIITKMTLTQVSTWFANARRRLKKENKMTWEPKNRNDDDDDDDDGCASGHSDDESSGNNNNNNGAKSAQPGKRKKTDKDGDGDEKSDCDDDSRGSVSPQLNNPLNHLPLAPHHGAHQHHLVHQPHHLNQHQAGGDVSVSVSVSNLMNNAYHHHHHHHHAGYPSGHHHSYHHQHLQHQPIAAEMQHHHQQQQQQHQLQLQPTSPSSSSSSSKPKIWSLADTAACKTPPPQGSAPPAHASGAHPGIQHHPLVPPSANHHAWFNGPVAGMTGAASNSAAAYGRYAPHPAPSGSYAGYAGSELCPPQTDTPPQTPPNSKTSNASHLGQQQQQQYQPYSSPQQQPQRIQQQQPQSNNPPLPPLPPTSEAGGEMLLSPGGSRQHQQQLIRPMYRT